MQKITFLIILLLNSIFLSLCSYAHATEYFIRSDGGTATQCTGTTDAAYPGSGEAQACAFIHPHWALAPQGNNPSKMVGSDIMTFSKADDVFEMGYGQPNTGDTTKCHTSWTNKCFTRTIPSGTSGNHTIIRGYTHDSGCTNPTILWGSEQLNHIFKVDDYTTIQCLELTDHLDCIGDVVGHTDKCSETYPAGDWAKNGIRNTGSSTDIVLKDLYIHGFAFEGILAGGFTDLDVDNVIIDGNGWAGWSFDVSGSPSNSGDLTFNDIKVRYNGCVEEYPQVATNTTLDQIKLDMSGCVEQQGGGYGDGFGTPATAGDWVFEDSDFIANSSDGLDLLYVTAGGSTIMKRNTFMNNNGNQVKTSGGVFMEDNKIIGHCDYLKEEAYVWAGSFNECRAGGQSITMRIREPGQTFDIMNNTIGCKGDIAILINNNNGVTCNGSEYVKIRNNIFLFGKDHTQGSSDQCALDYLDALGDCSTELDPDYGADGTNLAWGAKTNPCSTGDAAGFDCPWSDPDFVGITSAGATSDWDCTAVDTCDITLNAGSAALDLATYTTGLDSLDVNSDTRQNTWDAGADDSDTAAASCSTDCSLCGDQGTCEASAAFDCNATGFCCWNTDVCQETVASSCDADHCSLCSTQGTCEGVANSACTWSESSCITTPPDQTKKLYMGSGGVIYGNI